MSILLTLLGMLGFGAVGENWRVTVALICQAQGPGLPWKDRNRLFFCEDARRQPRALASATTAGSGGLHCFDTPTAATPLAAGVRCS